MDVPSWAWLTALKLLRQDLEEKPVTPPLRGRTRAGGGGIAGGIGRGIVAGLELTKEAVEALIAAAAAILRGEITAAMAKAEEFAEKAAKTYLAGEGLELKPAGTFIVKALGIVTGMLGAEAVTNAKIKKATITGEKVAEHTLQDANIQGGTLTYRALQLELKALIPTEVGLSEPMVLGKITIIAPFVSSIGPIIVVAEGGTAGQLTVTREPGVGFSVKAANSASTDRINWMVYTE